VVNVVAIKVLRQVWESSYAQAAHLAVFSEHLPPEYDRIDYALLLVDKDKDETLGYITLRELDKDSVYVKHGGGLPPLLPFHSFAVFRHALGCLLADYKRITMLVENTNTACLKMALSAGFKVIGIRHFKGALLLELFIGTEG
jgi:hypothetical protein